MPGRFVHSWKLYGISFMMLIYLILDHKIIIIIGIVLSQNYKFSFFELLDGVFAILRSYLWVVFGTFIFSQKALCVSQPPLHVIPRIGQTLSLVVLVECLGKSSNLSSRYFGKIQFQEIICLNFGHRKKL